MKKQLPLLITALMLLLAGCEKQINLDLDALDPEVVVRATGDNDSPLQLRLTYSRPTFGTFYVPDTGDFFLGINGASVTLTVNGIDKSPASSSDGNYSFAYTPQPGDNLTLSVNVPGHKTGSTTTEVPQKPVSTNPTVDFADEYYSITNFTVRFSLNDRADTKDYYSIRLFLLDTIYYTQYNLDSTIAAYDTVIFKNYLDFSCVDYTVITNTGIDAIDTEDAYATNKYWGEDFLFTDANINGLSHQFTLLPQDYGYGYGYYDEEHWGDMTHYWEQTHGYTWFLEVSALSRDNFLYQQSINAYEDDELVSLFGEPVQIHSNIDGGIGIFAIKSRTVIQLPIHD